MNISIGADIAIFGNIGYWQNLCWQADIFELDLHLVLKYCQYNNLSMPVCHIIKLHGFIGAAILILALVSVADIKTHDSESRGQEELSSRTRRMSELFTGSTALKFENAVTKTPRQLSPSYSGLSTF